MRKTLLVLLLALVLTCTFAVMAVPGSAEDGAPVSVFNFGYASSGGGGYFGNADGADLTGGKSLTMEFDLDKCTFGSNNYNVGFLVGDHLFAVNDPYVSGTHTFYWHSNWAYFDQRHCWAQSGAPITVVEDAGAVFDYDLLFDTLNIFKAGKSIRVVYTSYTETEGASIKIYMKDIALPEQFYTLASQVTNIPAQYCPDESAVWLAWYVGGNPVQNYTGSFTNWKMYGSDGADYSRINVGPNMIMDKVVEGVEEGLTAEYSLSYTGEGKNVSAWFGSNNGVDLQDGDSLTMTFDIMESSYPYGNYNVGFVLNGVGSDGNNNPYSADSEHGSYFFGNPAYGADNMILKVAGAGAVGAKVEGDFNPQAIMKAGNTVKVIYTYHKDGASTFDVYTRYKLDPEGYWNLVAKATDIPNAPSENVHMYWYTDSSMMTASSFGAKIKDYKIEASNGAYVDKSFTSAKTTFSQDVGGGINRIMILSGFGNKQADGSYTTGGSTWYGNIDYTNKDSMLFKVIKGNNFKIALNKDGRAEVSANTPMLEAAKIEYTYYKVSFSDTEAFLYGGDSADGDFFLVDKVAFAEEKFSVGIRLESDSANANALYIDEAFLNVGGDTYILTGNNGVPGGTTVIGNGSIFVSMEEFTVKFVTYDGQVINTQTVGYGTDAVIPEGNWENKEEAIAKTTFVDNDLTIFLIREGEVLDGYAVGVFNGTLAETSMYGDTFGVYKEGTEVTVVAREPDEREYWRGWSNGVEIVSTDLEYTFTVTESVKLTATYEWYTYDFKVIGGFIRGTDEVTEMKVTAYESIVAVSYTKEGYKFEGWYIGDKRVSRQARYTVRQMIEDVTVEARYTPLPYEIGVENGYIKGLDVSESEINYDSEVTVVASHEDPTLQFVGWSLTGEFSELVSQDVEYTFIVKGDQVVTAIYMVDPTVVTIENGHIDGYDSELIIENGSTITVVANEPEVGKQFWKWIDNIGTLSFENEYTFTVDGDVIITALYEVKDLSIKVENGYIGEEDVNEVVVKYGDTVTLKHNEPAFGYVFAGWSNGRIVISSDDEYTFEVFEDTVIYATYAEDLFEVKVVNGLVNGAESANIAYNAKVNVIAMAPDYGMYFEGWYIDGEKVSEDAKYTLTVLDAVTVTANYEKLDYTVTVTGGSFTDAEGESKTVPYLSEISVVADAPAPGFVFIGWTNGGSILSRRPEFTMTLERDTDLTAVYARERFIVNVVNGSVNGATSTYVELGTTITVVAKEKTGYVFKGWSNGVAMVSTDMTYTFEVGGTTTMTAVYDPNEYTITVVGGVLENGKTTDTISYGEEVTVKYNGNKTFEGWYVGETKVSSETTYVFTMKGDVIITAKTGGDIASGGVGCGSIVPNDKSNGGNMMIIGILALAVLAFVAMRHGKKLAKFAPKALVAVLCVALVAGVVIAPSAPVVAADADITAAGTSDGMNIVSTDEVSTYYFPVEDYAFGSDVRVTLDIKLNAAPVAADGIKYCATKFFTAGEVFVDDALPLNAWTKLAFETKVIAANGGFCVMLQVKNAKGLDMDIKNMKVDDKVVLNKDLLAGATMWMLPNTTSEQQMSFVIQTKSGKVIVIDGGVVGDANYLTEFLGHLTGEVDHWFVSHYHSDHIGALSVIVAEQRLKIKNLYTDFPTQAELDQYAAQDWPSQAYFGLLEDLEAGSPVVENWHKETGKAGTYVNIDDVRVKFLNDQMNFTNNYGNETNVTYRMDTGVQEDGSCTGESVLFLGDNGNGVGNWLMNNCLSDIQGCAIVQAAHHGQNGVTEACYQAIGGEIYIYCAPTWLWNCDSGKGIGSATYNTLVERNWQRKLGTVVKWHQTMNGLVTFR